MKQDDARRFLSTLASSGGGIVVSSGEYNYGDADYEDMSVVRDVPHAVIAMTDIRSLWTRVGILSKNGIAGDKHIEWRILKSKEWPEHFGYLLLKARSRPYPVVVTPVFMHNILRALSVFKVFEPAVVPGVVAEEASTPSDIWIRGCGRSVLSAMEFFGRSLKQPEEVLTMAKQMMEAKLPVCKTERERFQRVIARNGLGINPIRDRKARALWSRKGRPGALG